jgi:tRNA G18 (ribose-2'-O)-methylase SpoU
VEQDRVPGYRTPMRGYFGIGVERVSKAMNVGNLFRTAHAFGASFVFTVAADYSHHKGRSDTSAAPLNIPLYNYAGVADMDLPQDCELVGIELLDEAVELPSFRHPRQAAYVLGPERGVLSPALRARCRHVVKIPTAFCVNVGIAGAIVMYDRLLNLGRFAERPLVPGMDPIPRPDHVHGAPKRRLPKTK